MAGRRKGSPTRAPIEDRACVRPGCGNVFQVKTWHRRRYCSHACYSLTLRNKPGPNTGRFGYMKPGLEATKHPSLLDIAWAAGIYEGEGWCQRINTERAAIGQKDRVLLERLQVLFGGHITTAGEGREFVWAITGARARGFLFTIFTFLLPRRREQVRKVLA